MPLGGNGGVSERPGGFPGLFVATLENKDDGMITGEQVKAAMIAGNITRVNHHPCGLCGYMTAYVREDENLSFDSGCDCTYQAGGLLPRRWEDAADWIEMQSTPETKSRLMQEFGLQSP